MQLQQLIMTQNQSIAKLESQVGQLVEASMKREVGQLPSQPIANPRNQHLEFPPQPILLPQPRPPQQKGLNLKMPKPSQHCEVEES